jgi:lipid-binding SYLF domain-containing protein
MKLVNVSLLIICAMLLASCSAPGQTKDQQRSHINSMKNEVLTELYKLKPQARAEIRSAPGYAVFSNVNLNVIFASVGNGFGVVTDNGSGKQTYMKMGEVGIGLGLGAKDFRAVFVFQSREVMQRFVSSGWAFGGQADAAAKAETKGAAVAGEVVLDGIKVYQLTETGLALQATVKGTKYWKDGELN